MTIVIPDDLAAFTASLSSDRFAAVVSALASRPVSLTLPKFSFATREDLATILRGARDAARVLATDGGLLGDHD